MGIIGPRTSRAIKGVTGALTGPWGIAFAGATLAQGAFIASARSDSMGGVSITDASGTLLARHDARSAQGVMDAFRAGDASAVAISTFAANSASWIVRPASRGCTKLILEFAVPRRGTS